MALVLSGDGSITGNPDITLTESVSIAGTVTYEDVTNIDSVGIITAQSGINVTGGNVDVGNILANIGGVRTNIDGSVVINPASSLPSTAQRFILYQDRSSNTDTAVVFTKAGRADFAGRVFSNEWFQADRTDGSNSAFYATVSGVEKLNIRANGSASFAAGAFAINADGEIDTNVKSAGNLELDSTGAFTSPKVKLFAASGNATFAGSVESSATSSYAFKVNAGGFYANGSTGVSIYMKDGSSYPIGAWNDNNNQKLEIGDGASSSWQKITLEGSNGNATFLGYATVGDYQSGTAGKNGIQLRSFGEIVQNRNGGDAYTLYNNSSTKTIVFTASGTAKFIGDMVVGKTASSLSSQGFEIASGGQVRVTRGTNGDFAKFYHTSGTQIGAIRNISGTSTDYIETSDYRLKENVVDITDGIIRLKQLRPRRFNFIVDPDNTVDGFIAHEAQPVVPQAVCGTKDEVDENNDPVLQGIDKSKLVPLLTAALQEAIAKIETLETKVAALEGS